MADVFVYADETGNLDYDVENKAGATTYFGFGTAIFEGEHSDALWDGHILRASVEEAGYRLPKGFHAKNDMWDIRTRMLSLLAQQSPRIDATFLYKANAYSHVRAQGWEYLYKLAWFLHLKYLCQRAVGPDDHLYVVVATLGTNKRQTIARQAVQDVCDQMRQEITLCIWDAPTSWGLQVADYALWAVARNLEGGELRTYDRDVAPLVKSCFTPWGKQAS